MKKNLYNILLTLFIFFPTIVFAEGTVSVSASSLTIEQGSSKTFTITAYNAIGDVSIKSNNSDIASVSTNEWGTGMVEEKQTKKGTITVSGKSIGTTTITLFIDAATFDSEDLSGQTKTITVNVVAKQEPKPTPEDNLSKNNNIKSITAEGYKLAKVNNNEYTLTVTNNITSININAVAEDSKAKVSGNGNHELDIGENNIEVIVTSESGKNNKINIKITRKDGYYLEDLDLVLKNDELNDIDIIINSDSKITMEYINKIKDSKKTLKFNYYDENKNLVYSWIINGKEIKDSKEFFTNVAFTTENQKEIYKLSNYADGLYVNLDHGSDLPKGTKLKLYIGNKFEDGSNVNIYCYNNATKTLEFIKNDSTITDGYLELKIEPYSEYFITMSTIGIVAKEQDRSNNTFIIPVTVALVVIISLVIFIFSKFKLVRKDKKINVSQQNMENSMSNNFSSMARTLPTNNIFMQ